MRDKCWNCGMTFEVVERFRETSEVSRCTHRGCEKRFAHGYAHHKMAHTALPAQVYRERRDVERELGYAIDAAD